MLVNAHITIGSNSYEKVKTFKYLGSLLPNQNSIHEELKCNVFQYPWISSSKKLYWNILKQYILGSNSNEKVKIFKH